MTPSETAKLLAYCAAFDRRTVGKADVAAWHKLLGRYAYEDAETAVNEHYSAEHRWIMPADILRGIRRIRAQRIDAANPLYDGNPGETGIESGHNLRQLIRTAGDGHLGVRPVLQVIAERRPLELESGRPARLQEALAAIGTLPPKLVPGVTNPLAVGCPHCAAAPGRRCRIRGGKRPMADPHPVRAERAAQAAAGLDADGGVS
jgi:hypothetical protein